MRRACVAFAAAALCTALLTACSPRPPELAGRYVEHIDARDDPPWRALIGDFEFDFRRDGALHIRRLGGGTDVVARWRLDGDLLTVRETGGTEACRDSGLDLAAATYRVTFIADGVELHVVRDECRGRREAMPLRALRRVAP